MVRGTCSRQSSTISPSQICCYGVCPRRAAGFRLPRRFSTRCFPWVGNLQFSIRSLARGCAIPGVRTNPCNGKACGEIHQTNVGWEGPASIFESQNECVGLTRYSYYTIYSNYTRTGEGQWTRQNVWACTCEFQPPPRKLLCRNLSYVVMRKQEDGKFSISIPTEGFQGEGMTDRLCKNLWRLVGNEKSTSCWFGSLTASPEVLGILFWRSKNSRDSELILLVRLKGLIPRCHMASWFFKFSVQSVSSRRRLSVSESKLDLPRREEKVRN